MTDLFRGVSGSHLYGLNHAGSDLDYFVIIDKGSTKRARYAKQVIKSGVDSIETDLSTFMRYTEKGVPQYLEQMFSTVPDLDLIEDLRLRYRANPYQVERTYVRTIRNFWEADDDKRKRHAWRLYLNLTDLWETERFDPRMTCAERDLVLELILRGNKPPVLKEIL